MVAIIGCGHSRVGRSPDTLKDGTVLRGGALPENLPGARRGLVVNMKGAAVANYASVLEGAA